jgi:uncharacterized protein YbaR (Trm112 family)
MDASPDKPDGDVRSSAVDARVLELLACPEDLSPLRLATADELADVEQRVSASRLRRWDGRAVESAPPAMLLRADGRVAYEVNEDGRPKLLIYEALVLDESVGEPDPEGRRRALNEER